MISRRRAGTPEELPPMRRHFRRFRRSFKARRDDIYFARRVSARRPCLMRADERWRCRRAPRCRAEARAYRRQGGSCLACRMSNSFQDGRYMVEKGHCCAAARTVIGASCAPRTMMMSAGADRCTRALDDFAADARPRRAMPRLRLQSATADFTTRWRLSRLGYHFMKLIS